MDNSFRIITEDDPLSYLTTLAAYVVTLGLAPTFRVIYRAVATKDRRKFRDALQDLRAEIAAKKVKQ